MESWSWAVAAFSAVVGGFTDAAPVKSAQVPFESSRPGEIVVPVFVAGSGPYRFLLDTGSSHSAITPGLVARLGAPTVARAEVFTVAGQETCPIVRLTDVTIGTASAVELLATTLPLTSDGTLGDAVEGVIGQDFLARFNFTLDYRSRTVTWGDTFDKPEANRLALAPSEGRFLVELPQEQDCRCRVRFVPDSGADGLVLFTSSRPMRLAVTSSGGYFGIDGLIGRSIAQRVTLERLQVGSAMLRNHEAALVASDATGLERGDGLLPLHLFSRVHFNHREGYVQFDR